MGNLKAQVERLVEAYNRSDWAGLEDIYSDDIEYIEPLMPPFKGRRAVIDFLKGQKESFPDSQISVKRIIQEGDLVSAEFVFAGTNRGPLQLPSGTAPATNKRMSLEAVSVVRSDSNGKLLSQRQYYDHMEGMAQLGLLPTPATATA